MLSLVLVPGPAISTSPSALPTIADFASSVSPINAAVRAPLTIGPAIGPSVAIGHAKLAATLGYGGPIDVGLALEREAIGRVFVTDDADEGIKAFGEKRKANFKGH